MQRSEAEQPALELWAGVECTVNRVGDIFFDQMEHSGHAARLDDLDRFAALGIRTLRYPVLWERTAPRSLHGHNWSWADARLARLRALNIRPIVGLLHHGSGPAYTSLVDPEFPDKLAAYARAVATRYPWVSDYTPVNEPLTTARFSGLYGLWYPHGADDQTFTRALINECHATVLAMRAIREINPAARLIQTEDLGKAFSTPAMAHETAFQNQRRWLSFDLLCGRVGHDHPLWAYLTWAGIGEHELMWFCEHACPPDVIGINSYLTSERWLDDRLDHYPEYCRVRYGAQSHVDVAAVHVRAAGLVGHRTLLAEAWERYGLPLAITEAHAGGGREDQLRWLVEIWDAAYHLRASGVDLRAVTVWALLGAYDWNSLVTRREGWYEPGVFDVRGSAPRPTALARLVQSLAAGGRPHHAVLDTPGWWRRPSRFCFRGCEQDAKEIVSPASIPPACTSTTPRPILIAGVTGTLGRAFARLCEERGLASILTSRPDLDIAAPDSVRAAVERFRPWAIVNAAGYVRVDDAESTSEQCMRENADGPATLAETCATKGIRLLTFSSDLVFDGAQGQPYLEHDPVAPLNVYGHSKALAEQRVLALLPDALVVRTSAFFGAWDEHNFVIAVLRALAAGEQFRAAEDVTVAPTYVPDLVHTCLDLLVDGAAGIWHLANSGSVTWAELAREVAERAGYRAGAVVGVPMTQLGLPARRPAYSVLGSTRGQLPALGDALDRFFLDCSLPSQMAAQHANAQEQQGITGD